MSKYKKFSEKTLVFFFAVITLFFLICVPLTINDRSTLLSICGIWVSVVGVLLAYAIYRRQTIDSEASEQRLTSSITAQSELVNKALTSATESDPKPSKDFEEDPDFFAEATEIATNVGVLTGAEQDFYLLKREDIPLSVLSDLVTDWQDKEFQGKWTVSNAEYALRRIGKGNHPWFVIFKDSSEKQRMWKITRGGQRKASATVQEIALSS